MAFIFLFVIMVQHIFQSVYIEESLYTEESLYPWDTFHLS